MTPRLKEKYLNQIIPEMMKEFSYRNVMQVPKVQNEFMGDVSTVSGIENVVLRAQPPGHY